MVLAAELSDSVMRDPGTIVPPMARPDYASLTRTTALSSL
jgi:hypothetical protein